MRGATDPLKAAEIWLLALVVLVCSACRVPAQESRAYLTVFQSGKLVAMDPHSGAIRGSTVVRDDAGIAAIAWSPGDNASTLFVLDGDTASRLRALDPASLSPRHEVNFADRLLRFGDYRLIYASRDGRWLFVSTYRYQDARRRLRVVDVTRSAFENADLPAPCSEPLVTSARQGSVFLLCPGRLLAGHLDAQGAFTLEVDMALPLTEVLAAAATPDGGDLYAIGTAPSGDQQKLVHWRAMDSTFQEKNAAAMLDSTELEQHPPRQVWLDISPDAHHLVVVQGSHLRILDRASLALAGRSELPSAARAAALDTTDGSVLTVHSPAGANQFLLVRTTLPGGKSSVVSTQLAASNAPVAFAVGVVRH